MAFLDLVASSSAATRTASSSLSARRSHVAVCTHVSTTNRRRRRRRLMTSKYKTMTTFVTRSSYSTLEQILGSIKDLPPSERPDALRAAEQPVKSLLNEMKEKNQISKWNSLGKIKSENVFPRAFTEVGLNDVTQKLEHR